ncbi:MAG: PAS domain S-box protein [Gemmatimonadaceae bacterium]|nr:PAS domain S-box protein [Gemmatimonadaceae bacterium]
MTEFTSSGSVPTDPAPTWRAALRSLETADAARAATYMDSVEEQLRRTEGRIARLARAQEISASLIRTLDRSEIASALCEQLWRLLGSAGVAVSLTESPGTSDAPCICRSEASEDPESAPDYVRAAIAEAARTARVQQGERSAERGAMLAVPMLHGRSLSGVIAVWERVATPLDDDVPELVASTGRLAALALANAALFAESQRERRIADALASVAAAVNGSLRLADVLRLGLRQAMGLFGVEGADVAVRQECYLHVLAGEGAAEPLIGMYVPIESSIAGRAVTEARTVIANDVTVDSDAYRHAVDHVQMSNVMLAPLITPTGVNGTLGVFNRAEPFTEDDARVLQRLATTIAVALENARLFAEATTAEAETSVAFDAIPSGVAVLDGEGRVIRSNASLRAMLSVDQSIDGCALVELVEGEATDSAFAAALVGACDEGRTTRFEILRAANGRRLEGVAAPHPAGGAVVSLDDVTAIHAAREAAQRATDTLDDLVTLAPDAIVTIDREARFTSINPAGAAMMGFTRAEMVGHSIVPFIEPAEAAMLLDVVRATLAGDTRRVEFHAYRKDGERRLASAVTAPLRRAGQPDGLLAIVRDVTDERERALALERAEAQYARVIEAATDAICTVDEEGHLTSANSAFLRVVGRTRDAVLGRPFQEMTEPGEQATVWKLFVETMGGHPQRVQVTYFDHEEQRPGIATVVTAPITEGDRVTGAVAIFRDVTEERRLFEQLARRDKLAALGELVGGVAHEVNTPLAGILAYAQILMSGQGTHEDQRRATETIVTEAKRAARIVTKLLTFARQNPPEKMPTDVRQVMVDTLELRRYPLRLQEIALETEFAEGLPLTWADPFQLQQVFINLLANAEQALVAAPPPRRIVVRVVVDGAELVASVRDSGPGIPPEHLPHIFNPFYTTKPRGIGTGLGLSISDGIVREHGGTLSVHSIPGQGATFEVRLPVYDAASPTTR